MPVDFTYDMYAELLEAGINQGISFITVKEYLNTEVLPSEFVILRHDVDRKPINARDFARIEAERGVNSTYYFRTVEETFQPEVMEDIDSLGHEIGYHYEDLDRTDGDVSAAHASFRENLEKLRNVVPVSTVCMHGNPLTAYDNRDIWNTEASFEDYDLRGEAYLSMDFSEVDYYSDTGRTWRDGPLKIKDHTVGDDGKTIQISTTDQLISLLESDDECRLCILTHPDRWANSFTERVVEGTFDAAKNTAKRALHVFPVL